MEFDDFPEKPKRSEKSKKRFFTRRLRYRGYIVALLCLNACILNEFWLKPAVAKLFAETVIGCIFP